MFVPTNVPAAWLSNSISAESQWIAPMLNPADAPSGTSIATAKAMAEARGKPFQTPATEKQTVAGTRGGLQDGVTIHSVRLPGLVAHQQVMFGAPGETLTIRHDSMHRESFMPGVILAVRGVMERAELVRGLDRLIGLG